MGNTVAKITSKIVDITENPDTKAFVGKIVTRKNTEKGIVYAIGSTGYVLSAAEYKMFAEAGAIAQSSLLPKKKTQSATSPAPVEKASANQASQKAAKSARAMAASASKDIRVRSVDEFEFGTEDHHAMLETSEFLLNYPKPSFDMETPKHMGFLDKKDDFKERATGFFDRIGRRGRDKLVSAMTQE